MRPKAFIAARGREACEKRLARAKNFYGALPEMPDARALFDAVKHLKPTILTGLPIGKWAAPQGGRGPRSRLHPPQNAEDSLSQLAKMFPSMKAPIGVDAD